MPFQLIQGPIEEPLTLAEAKLHLKVDSDLTDDDSLIIGLIAAAREFAETKTQTRLVTQKWKLILDAFPGPALMGIPVGMAFSDPAHAILIPKGPLASVDALEYLDMGGVWQTVALPDPAYDIDLFALPARMTPAFGRIWPIPMPQISSIKVGFTVGYGAGITVPQGIKQWMLLRITSLYEHRGEAAVLKTGRMEPLPWADRLLDGYTNPVY
jgi:uncharacterized phiE125 gp8 family phage protein